jgi:hypothetical protein
VEETYEEVPTWGQAVKGEEVLVDRVLREAGEPPVLPRCLTVADIAFHRLREKVRKPEDITP